ncbi:MAG: hypothetical protein AB8B49_05940 [Nitratireductor sp.]
MRAILFASLLIFSFAQSGLAKTCNDDFLKSYAVTDETVFKPMRAQMSTKMSNGMEMESIILSVSKDHMMTQTISPPTPWTLIYDGSIFISSDKGKAWTKISTMPKQVLDEKALAAKAEAIKKIGNEVCESVNLDGKQYTKISADLDTSQSASSKTNVAYYIEEESQEVTIIETKVETGGVTQLITQRIEYDASLTLPMPK